MMTCTPCVVLGASLCTADEANVFTSGNWAWRLHRYLQMCSRGDKGAGRKQEDRKRLQQLIDELRDKGGILHLLSHRVAWRDPARRTVASSLSPREFQVTGTRDMKRRC
eukprot:43949-Eustigmatos_ZCMA.PRE.1